MLIWCSHDRAKYFVICCFLCSAPWWQQQDFAPVSHLLLIWSNKINFRVWLLHRVIERKIFTWDNAGPNPDSPQRCVWPGDFLVQLYTGALAWQPFRPGSVFPCCLPAQLTKCCVNKLSAQLAQRVLKGVSEVSLGRGFLSQVCFVKRAMLSTLNNSVS